jgi:hypothetical protein
MIEIFLVDLLKKHWLPIDGKPKHFSATNHCYLLFFATEFFVAMCIF